MFLDMPVFTFPNVPFKKSTVVHWQKAASFSSANSNSQRCVSCLTQRRLETSHDSPLPSHFMSGLDDDRAGLMFGGDDEDERFL
jgi:hypothetical protein